MVNQQLNEIVPLISGTYLNKFQKTKSNNHNIVVTSSFDISNKYSDFFMDTKKIGTSSMAKFSQRMIGEQMREKLIENICQDVHSQSKDTALSDDGEQNLATELSALNRDRFVKEKMRQRLRESNQELRELEVKLRSAYVAKSLAAQIANKHAHKKRERIQQEMEKELIERARIQNEEYAKTKEEDDRKQKEELRCALKQQMDTTEIRKRKRYEEFLKEKKIFDDIIRKIYEEQLEEMRDKLAKKAQLRSEMDKFIKAQKLWKEKQKTDTEEENRRFEAYIREQEEKTLKEVQKRKEMEESRINVSEQLGDRLKRIDAEKKKRQDLLIDLHIEELKEKEDAKFREDIEKQLRKRIQNRLQLDEQRKDNAHRRWQDQEDDRLFREDQLRLMAERDKIDQLSDEKRRKKIMEHRRDIQESLEKKKLIRAQEVATLIKERERDLHEEQKLQNLIEEERIRMLQEHANNLIGFLPPGILKEKDREFLPLP